jgi:hypothetical protein
MMIMIMIITACVMIDYFNDSLLQTLGSFQVTQTLVRDAIAATQRHGLGKVTVHVTLTMHQIALFIDNTRRAVVAYVRNAQIAFRVNF